MKEFLTGLWMGTRLFKRTTRLRAAWHVLQGRPLIYRARLQRGPGVINIQPGWMDHHVVEVHMDLSENAPGGLSL